MTAPVFAGRPVFPTALTDAFGNGRSGLSLSIYERPTYTDGVTVNGDTLLESDTADFTSDDEDLEISAEGFPASVTIAEYVSPSSVRLSAPATSSGTGRSFNIAGRQRVEDLATVYSDRMKSTVAANPYVADVEGNSFPYLDPGDYDAVTVHGVTSFTVLPDPQDVADLAANKQDAATALNTGATQQTKAGGLVLPNVRIKSEPYADPMAWGAVGDGVADDYDAVVAARDAVANGGKVLLTRPFGMRSGLSMAGKRCVLDGVGDHAGLWGLASVTAAMLDMTGYLYPNGFTRSRAMRNFTIRGNGTAGITKKGIVTGISSTVDWYNVSVEETGGVPWEIFGAQCDNFYSCIANRPIKANGNNVPYVHMRGAANGHKLVAFGLRSIRSAGSLDAAGEYLDGMAVVLIEDDDTLIGTPDFISWDEPWVEFLHTPDGGTIFDVAANDCRFKFKPFDNSTPQTGANTQFVRLRAPAAPAVNFGGNIVSGWIPGGGAGTYARGVLVEQRGCRIVGTKGYPGNNVELAAGVTKTKVELGGQVAASGIDGIVDNSGTFDNHLIDSEMRYEQIGRIRRTVLADGTVELRDMSAAGTPLITRTAATEHRLYMSGVAGNPIALAVFEREMRLANVAWARLGVTAAAANSLPYLGYNFTHDPVDNRFEHAVDGPVAGFVFENTGQVAFYVGATQVAGTPPSKKVTITNVGTLVVKPGDVSAEGLTLFSANYGLGMDASDIVIHSNAGQGIRFRADSISGAIWGRLTSAGLAVTGGIGLNGAAVAAKSTGWGAPTGTTTKTTFDTATVTLSQLAERVKALLDYLTTRGDIGP